MRTIRDFDFNNKRTLVRCDFNVPLSPDGKRVVDDFKIVQALETIHYLKSRGAKVVLMSHLSPIEEASGGMLNKYSLLPVSEKLANLLRDKVGFCNKCCGKKVQKKVNNLKNGEVLLLENLRQELGEEKNSYSFALELAKLGDVYVNEAFSVCHRRHASVVALPSLMERFAGLNLEKEVMALSRVLNPERPLTVIVGGAKLESKISMIERFLEKGADYILVGGKLVEAIFAVKGICLGREWPHKEVSDIISKIDLTNPKLKMPIDGLISPNVKGDVYVREGGPGTLKINEQFFDIGPFSQKIFADIISQSKVIFWAGPLGLVESSRFADGTRKVAEAILNNREAFSVIGGGDTISALRKVGLTQGFSHLSTGGGAMLAFLAGSEMPGLAALEDDNVS